MKTVIKILILVLLVYLSYSLVAKGQISAPKAASEKKTMEQGLTKAPQQEEKSLDIQDYDNPDLEDEDLFPYDQDFLTRKLFQKKLPPLTPKEQIVWSFRMADTNIFL